MFECIGDDFKKIIEEAGNGLYLRKAPTGSGKGYQLGRAISEYVEEHPEGGRKIVVLAYQKKTVEETLGELSEKARGASVYVRSIQECLLDTRKDAEDKTPLEHVPEKFHTKTYKEMKRLAEKLAEILNSHNKKDETREYYADKLDKTEHAFRREIKKAMAECLKTNPGADLAKEYGWLKYIYNDIEIRSKPVIFMTMHKFLNNASGFAGLHGEVANLECLEGAAVFIDEFDQTKKVVTDIIIDRAINAAGDYKRAFNTVAGKFTSNDNLPKPVRGAFSTRSYAKLSEEAKNTTEEHRLELAIKYEKLDDRNRPFIFYTGRDYHTITSRNKAYRYLFDMDGNRNIIMPAEKTDEDDMPQVSVYKVVTAMEMFLRHFRNSSRNAAVKYTSLENEKRKGKEIKNKNGKTVFVPDSIEEDESLETVYQAFGLDERQVKMLANEGPRYTKKLEDFVFDNTDVYCRGISYIDMQNDNRHNESTDLYHIRIPEFPEHIIGSFTEKKTVTGFSATCETDTGLGNYDLGYFEEKLKENFHPTPEKLEKQMTADLDKQNGPYRDGRITIYSLFRDIDDGKKLDYAQALKNTGNTFQGHESILEKIVDKINEKTEKKEENDEYYKWRYLEAALAMADFFSHEWIRAMMCFSMMAPKHYNDISQGKIPAKSFDKGLLREIFELVREGFKRNGKLFTTDSDTFETTARDIKEERLKGERVFLIAAYNTIGTGVNLQYETPQGETTIRLDGWENAGGSETDFNAIYLMEITNLKTNLGAGDFTQKNLLRGLMETETLREKGEINPKKAQEQEERLFTRFGRETAAEGTDRTWPAGKLPVTPSERAEKAIIITQATGRINRARSKCPEIYIAGNRKIMDGLSEEDFSDIIRTPELETFINCLNNNHKKTGLPEELEIITNRAKNTNINARINISQYLAHIHNAETIQEYKNLRECVLKYPTAGQKERDAIKYIRSSYVTRGSEMSSYEFVVHDSGYGEAEFNFWDDMPWAGGEPDSRIPRQRMDETGCRLDVMLRYDGMEEYFREQGYATSFAPGMWMMSPVVYNNIYKGALGETAGRFILEKLGIKLSELDEKDINMYEYFDFILKDGVYIDFKNWSPKRFESDYDMKMKIYGKMDMIGAEKAYIINIYAGDVDTEDKRRDLRARTTADGRITEIPWLIDSGGAVNEEALATIRKETDDVY